MRENMRRIFGEQFAATLRRRLVARAVVLPAAGAFVLANVALNSLPLGPALLGLAAAAAWVLLWPMAPPSPSQASVETGFARGDHPVTPLDLCRSLLQALEDAAFILDRDGRVLAANESAAASLSVREGQQIALTLRAPKLLEAMASGHKMQAARSFEIEIAVPVKRHLAGIAAPLPGLFHDTSNSALVVVLRDRTEEQRLAEMRADFVANASHELRTPLTSLKGFIETLQGAAKEDPAAREKFLPIMQEQADRMTRLIEDLLSLSRIEMSAHVPPRTIVDVAEIAETVGKALQPIASAAARHLSIALLERPAFVTGDRDELMQVVQNLAQNGLKYGQPHGVVAISIRREGSNFALVVADDGIGIAPEHLPRLTERFYRVSAKASRERGGTGLGLAIVKHIVSRHRGELKIESQLGKGSTFTVLLPAAPAGRKVAGI